MNGRIDLSVVLPAYGEAESLTRLLPRLRAALRTLDATTETVVVDARAPLDATPQICFANGVRHVPRRGGERYGDAVRTGIASARGTFVLFMDADGSHDPAAIAAMWARRSEAEIVVGSRYVPGGRSKNPPALVAMSFVLRLVFRTAFALAVRDVTTSLRLYDGRLLRSLAPIADDFDILEEILIDAIRTRSARVVEVPVTFERRYAGESKRELATFAASYARTLRRLLRGGRVARREASPS